MQTNPIKAKRFTLFYPSQELGGAELLLSRIADKLAERGHQVTVFDSEKRFIEKSTRNPAVRCRVAKLDHPIAVESDHLITFASHISSLRRFVEPDESCNVLFWSIHPLNAIFLPPRLGERAFSIAPKLLKALNLLFFEGEVEVRAKALNSLLDSDAFVCMDGENIHVLSNYYDLNSSRFKFVPIPILPRSTARSHRSPSPRGIIQLTWYGRLCDFKVTPLLYLISQIRDLKERALVKLTIIGDGPLRDLVEESARRAGIAVDFKGTMQNDAARAFLRQHADITFAMGTAALEAAADGIPTVLVDASYRPINFPYGFSWLYHTERFTLGRFIRKRTPYRGISLEKLIVDTCANYEQHARASFEYASKNHDIEHVVDLLEQQCEKSRMSLTRLHELTTYRKPLLLRVARKLRPSI